MAFARLIIPLISKAECQEDWKNVCDIVSPCVFQLFCATSKAYCGGFFINSSGLGISAYHFYSDADFTLKNTILTHNGMVYFVDLIKEDSSKHLIIVKARNLIDTPFLKFNKYRPQKGTEVALFSMNPAKAIIFESGYVLDSNFSPVSNVEFSCIRSSCRGGPGYSGGPVVNRSGQVLGQHKSYSDLFNVFDSLSIPSEEIYSYLSSMYKETEKGWQS